MENENIKHKRDSAAFTLIEVLISLSILAMLLAAIGVAFDASAKNYADNERLYRLTSLARQSLIRITTELRTSKGVALSEPVNQCSLVTSDDRDITYFFNSSDGTLYLITNNDLTDDDYVLCTNIQSMQFIRQTDPLNPGTVISVQINITLVDSDLSEKLTAAVTLRKNTS